MWVFGTHGVILLQNTRRISVKNVTVRKSKPFAIHLGNVHEFEIDGLTLEDHYRDGVHVNGPASQGTIRNVRGNSHDDPVALNAWEWKNYALTYGPIRDVLVENVTGASSGTNAIRLLPGVKRFDDGTELGVSWKISRCVISPTSAGSRSTTNPTWKWGVIRTSASASRNQKTQV